MKGIESLPGLHEQIETSAMPEARYLKFSSLPQQFKEKGLPVEYDDLYAFVLRYNRRNRSGRIRLFHLPDRGGLQISREDAARIFDMLVNPEKYIEPI